MTIKLSNYIGAYWASAEVMYAVIIAITFTSTLRGFENPIGNYYTIVYSALFCCMAWGIADGLFYSWERVYIARTENEIIEASKTVEKKEAAISLVREELNDTILRNIDDDSRKELYEKLVNYLAGCGVKEKPSGWDIFNIVLGTFIVSTLAGLIIVIPFFLIDNLRLALDISNAFGIFLLFIIGFYRSRGRSLFEKVRVGLGTALIGIIITIITTILGG